MYVEKLIVNPHHIEVQNLSRQIWQHGFLGERDCSIQRNNQKTS
ncbi:hypothetical protein [Lachnobacterium bovis]